MRQSAVRETELTQLVTGGKEFAAQLSSPWVAVASQILLAVGAYWSQNENDVRDEPTRVHSILGGDQADAAGHS